LKANQTVVLPPISPLLLRGCSGIERSLDEYAAGVAGASVVDCQDYDTFYTERYLSLPEANPEGYRRSKLPSYADRTSRSLFTLRGVTDDNAYSSTP
jgi:dipeptidyl-peptidase-4